MNYSKDFSKVLSRQIWFKTIQQKEYNPAKGGSVENVTRSSSISKSKKSKTSSSNSDKFEKSNKKDILDFVMRNSEIIQV